MGRLIIMEQTFNIFPEKDRREVLEKGKVKQIESTVKYLIIEE